MKKLREKNALSTRTLKMYAREIIKFKEHFEDLYGKKPQRGDDELLREYLIRCRVRYQKSPSGLFVHLAAVKFWMETCSTASPWLRGIAAGIEFGPRRILDETEAGRLLGGVEPPLCALMLRFIHTSGARLQETLRIRVGDLEPTARVVMLRDGDDRRCRETILPPHLMIQFFRETNYKKPTDYLFSLRRAVDKSYLPVSNRTLQQVLGRAAVKAGLEGVTVQTLRDSFAVNMIRKGIDPRLIMRLMGYRSSYSFRRYRSYMRESLTDIPPLLLNTLAAGC